VNGHVFMPKFLASIWTLRTELCVMMNVFLYDEPFLLGAFLSAREKEKCRRTNTAKKITNDKTILIRKNSVTITNESEIEINLKI
jgi:hypothetical protein